MATRMLEMQIDADGTPMNGEQSRLLGLCREHGRATQARASGCGRYFLQAVPTTKEEEFAPLSWTVMVTDNESAKRQALVMVEFVAGKPHRFLDVRSGQEFELA